MSAEAGKVPHAPANDERVRCPWCLAGNDLYIRYHDTEWGVPAYDDQTQFEFLILEGAQAGLSWATILNKREGYREAFAGFDAEKSARFGKREVAKLHGNPVIVRNRLKVEAGVGNARAMRTRHLGSRQRALSTWIAAAPARRNAWASSIE